MLNSTGFDLWADDYDKSVGLSDEDGTYPFAGYRDILGTIYRCILSSGAKNVLDIGFGTAVLAAQLYAQGCRIYGQDFSARMIALAREKMPDASLYQGDFTQGLVPELAAQQYDAIVATYSLHHLTDTQKVSFLTALTARLAPDGCIYIGDVAFQTRAQLEQCCIQAGDKWDSDEIYFVYDELKAQLPGLTFTPLSPCAGLLTLNA